ncbi:hypothetical protein BDV19DRAFT_254022 [Aspergillus venezuelensis]
MILSSGLFVARVRSCTEWNRAFTESVFSFSVYIMSGPRSRHNCPRGRRPQNAIIYPPPSFDKTKAPSHTSLTTPIQETCTPKHPSRTSGGYLPRRQLER